jgi:hypothetical protein
MKHRDIGMFFKSMKPSSEKRSGHGWVFAGRGPDACMKVLEENDDIFISSSWNGFI